MLDVNTAAADYSIDTSPAAVDVNDHAAFYASRPWTVQYGDMPKVLPEPEYNFIVEMIDDACKYYGDRKAFTTVTGNGMNGSLTFREVDELSDAMAVYLREELGLQPGERVAIQAPNCLSYPVAAIAILKARLVLVNVNPLYTEEEMIKQFNDAGVETLLMIDLFGDKLESVMQRTDLRNVVLISLAQYFPAIPGYIVRKTLKWWNRMIPKVEVPYADFGDAVKTGRRIQREKNIDVKEYGTG